MMLTGIVSYWVQIGDLSFGHKGPSSTLIPDEVGGNTTPSVIHASGYIKGLEHSQIGVPFKILRVNDRLYIVDAFATEGMIKVFDLAGNFSHAFGVLGQDELAYIVDIALDKNNNIVVLDSAPAVHIFDLDGKHLRRTGIIFGESRQELAWAKAVMPTSDGYFVLSFEHLFKVDIGGKISAIYPQVTDQLKLGVAPSEFYLGPSALALDSSGKLWISDSVNRRFVRLGENGLFDHTVDIPKGPSHPTSFILDEDGNFIYINSANGTVAKLSVAGVWQWEFKLAGAKIDNNLDDICDLLLGQNGELYVSNGWAGSIEKWDISAKPKKIATTIKASA
ncbi:MAG: 6-bladed beta-propeller, partial [bacterium]|nr:6-bladed beta-propeller [bacterium]